MKLTIGSSLSDDVRTCSRGSQTVGSVRRSVGTEQQVTRHSHSVPQCVSSHPTTERGNARQEHREDCYRHRTVIQGLMGTTHGRPEQQQPRRKQNKCCVTVLCSQCACCERSCSCCRSRAHTWEKWSNPWTRRKSWSRYRPSCSV